MIAIPMNEIHFKKIHYVYGLVTACQIMNILLN